MLKIGLTGGIGSGKSTVAKIFESLGIAVYNADIAAKRLMNENKNIKEQIENEFGTQSYLDNSLDRAYIASVVFNNPSKLTRLNSITHPATIEDANQWLAGQKGAYAIKEAALIFESGSEKYLDYIIGVFAPDELRIQRTMQRDNLSRAKVLERLNKQMPQEEKMKRCDFVIDNSEIWPLLPQVVSLHQKLLNLNNAEKPIVSF